MPTLVSRIHYIGVDPGKNGCAAAVDLMGEPVSFIQFGKATEHDVSEWFCEVLQMPSIAVLELVRSSPQMGVASAFTFGSGYGFVRGILTAHRVRYSEATPQTWQRFMKCLSKGDKNVTKAAAQRRWPREKFNHGNADAFLIAEYCRLTDARGKQ